MKPTIAGIVSGLLIFGFMAGCNGDHLPGSTLDTVAPSTTTHPTPTPTTQKAPAPTTTHVPMTSRPPARAHLLPHEKPDPNTVPPPSVRRQFAYIQ